MMGSRQASVAAVRGASVAKTAGGGQQQKIAPGGEAGHNAVGVAIRITKRCDCSTFANNVRVCERAIGEMEADRAAARAWLDSAYAAMFSWDDYERDLLGWLDEYQLFKAKIAKVISSWLKYIGFLESIMGPISIAGRDKYDNRPHDGWVEVSEGFWANSEEAAAHARLAYQVSQLLAGGLMSGPQGLRYYGALAIAQMKLSEAEDADMAAWAQSMDVYREINKCDAKIAELQRKIADKEMQISTYDLQLVQMRENLEAAMKALKACLSAVPPNCPVGAPVYDQYEVLDGDDSIPQPDGATPDMVGKMPDAAPEVPAGTIVKSSQSDEDALGGILEGFIGLGTPSEAPTTGGIGAAPPKKPEKKAPEQLRQDFARAQEEYKTLDAKIKSGQTVTREEQRRHSVLAQEIYEAPDKIREAEVEQAKTEQKKPADTKVSQAPSKPKGDATFLLTGDQKKEIGGLVKKRGEIRTQIKEIESKPDKTEADKKKLVELKEEEAALSLTISNTIAKSHNENVDKIGKERAEQERKARSRSTLDPKNVEKVEQLTKERATLANKKDQTDADRSRIKELDKEITEAKRTAVKNARPVTIPKEPAPEFDKADTEKINKLQEERTKLRTEIYDLEDKEKAGTLDATGAKKLEELRARWKTHSDEFFEATKTASRNAREREIKRRQEDARKEAERNKPPELDPADRTRLNEKQAKLEEIENQLLDYWTKSKSGTFTEEERKAWEALRKQYRAQINDIARDYKESEARAPEWQKREMARRTKEATKSPPTVDEQYEAAKTAQPISEAARRALEDAKRKTEVLQTEAAKIAERIKVLEGMSTRSHQDEVELADLKQKLTGDIPGQINDIVRDTIAKFPELAPEGRRPPATPAATTVAPSREEPPTAAQVKERIAKMRHDIEEWARGHLRITDTAHPFIELVLAIGVNLGPSGLADLLAGTKATDPLNAVLEVALLASQKLPLAGSLALLENIAALLGASGTDAVKRLWGTQPVNSELRTRFIERVSELALQSGALGSLANALELQFANGAGAGNTATKLKTKIAEVFPRQFDASKGIAAFETTTAPLPEKAAQLAGLVSWLRKLFDLTGSTAVKTALDALSALATNVAQRLNATIAKVTSEVDDAGKAEDANRALIKRLEDVGLKDMTAAEAELYDRIAPGWRDWLGHENFMQRTGEYAARRIVDTLGERQSRLGTLTSRAVNTVASLDRLRLQLLYGHLPASERSIALNQAFAASMAVANSFEGLMLGSGITGQTEAHLAALRAKTESAQTLALAGDRDGIVAQLEDIRKELNGWDEHREITDHLLGETIHHEGLREKLYRLDKNQESFDETKTTGADADPKLREARLTRERIAYLQQRRVDLMLADPAHFSYASLQSELARDAAYWEHRKPWKELAWISGDKTSEPVWQQTEGAKLHELPMLAWQMATAQKDPQSFMAFLRQLQEEKIRRGDKAWTDYQNTPWWRRGAGTQTDRLLHAAEIMDEMYAKDQTLLNALAGGASVSVEKLPQDLKATLRANGFITTGSDGKEHYSVPSRFHWDAVGVLELKSQRDAYDEILNLSNVAQMVSTYVIGGWAGTIGRSFQLTEGVYAGWLVFGSRVAIETTAFMTAEAAIRGGNIFGLLLGNTSLKDLGKEWLQTALTIGGLQMLAPWLESMEHSLQGNIPQQDLARGWNALWETGSAKKLLNEAFANIVERSFAAGARLTADLAFMTAVNAVFGEKITSESLGRTIFMLGVMRTSGLFGEAQARDLYRQAREFGRLITRAQENYRAKVEEVFEEAKADGRTELNDHERSVLDAARQQLTVSTGKLDLAKDFRDIETELGTKFDVQVGEAKGAWREVAKSEAKQRDLFGGKTLLEALRTLDGNEGDPFAVRYRTALRAAARFMYEAGSWVGTKQEMFKDHPEVAKALFEVRKVWAEWIRKNYSASVIGTVSDMRNDCDFNFALGEGEAFNPVPRMLAAKAWTKALVRDLLIEAGLTPEQANAADHEILFETNSYTDPGIIHLYTRLPAALQAEVIRSLTRDSIGLAEYWVKHHLGALPPEVTARALHDLAIAGRDATVRTPDEMAADLGIRDWDTPEGNERLYAEQNRLFGEYARDPNNAEIVRQICELQMLINSRAQGAYITPGAALVTVSIKEGKLSQDMRMIREQLDQLKAGEQTAATKTLIGALERALDEIRLEQIKGLTVDEALQSVIGDMVFFWHIAEEASKGAQAFDVAMRYEFSKYVARLLEVAKVHGMDPTSGVAGDHRFLGIAKLLKIATRIYKGKKPGEVFAGEDPALAGISEMREYLEAVQRASGDVIRYLLERSSVQPVRRGSADAETGPLDPSRTPWLGEWLDTPDRGWQSDNPASRGANLHLVNLLASENALNEAMRGELHGARNADALVSRNYQQYLDALTAIRDGARSEGVNYWEHFDLEDAAMLQECLATWDRNGQALPPIDIYRAAVSGDPAQRAKEAGH